MLGHLVLLDALVVSSSVESAAAALDVSEAELLRDLNELGDALGVPLVDRQLRPTVAASRLADPARAVLRRADALFSAAEVLGADGRSDPPVLWTGDGLLPSALADSSCHYLEVNEAFARMVGRDSGALIGVDFRRITHEADIAADEHHDEELSGGQLATYSKRKRYLTPQGGVRRVVVTCSRVTHDGEMAYLVVATPQLARLRPAA